MRAIRLALGLCLGAAAVGGACVGQEIVPEDQIIEHKLDTTQSRVLRNSTRPLGSPDPLGSMDRPLRRVDRPLSNPESARESSQVTRDLGASRQRLRSLQTRTPNAPSIPLLERQLDRLSRPTNLRR
jgi:hypothetical protein